MNVNKLLLEINEISKENNYLKSDLIKNTNNLKKYRLFVEKIDKTFELNYNSVIDLKAEIDVLNTVYNNNSKSLISANKVNERQIKESEPKSDENNKTIDNDFEEEFNNQSNKQINESSICLNLDDNSLNESSNSEEQQKLLTVLRFREDVQQKVKQLFESQDSPIDPNIDDNGLTESSEITENLLSIENQIQSEDMDTEDTDTEGLTEEVSQMRRENSCLETDLNEIIVLLDKYRLFVQKIDETNELNYNLLIDLKKEIDFFNTVYNLEPKPKNTKRYKCCHQRCNQTFGYKYQLTQHKRTHTRAKPFKCGINGYINSHQKRVHFPKKYKCNWTGCHQVFPGQYLLIEHKRSHTKEKPFLCDVCGKSFSKKHNLIQHKKVHKNK